MAPRTWTNDGGTPLSAQNLNAMETDIAGKITAPADPDADRILFWDDSAGAYTHLTASTGLSISGTTLSVVAANESTSGRVELATAAETATGTDNTRAVHPAGLKPLLDAKSDVVNKGYRYKSMSAAPDEYPVGATVFLAAGSDGWVFPNGESFGQVFTLRQSFATGGTIQIVGPYNDDTKALSFRVWEANATAWGPLQSLATEGYVASALAGKSDTSHTHTAATSGAAGFMSAADKALLDAATAAATNSSIVRRDLNGNSVFGAVIIEDAPTAATHATRKDYVDAQIAAVLEYSDDVPQETIFDVNSMSGVAGAKVTVPTHISNPGETTHPSVLFFPEGWGSPVKWKYWMAHTPYPGGNDDHEDPSIAVSNDGISWQVPAGVTNPLADADGQPEYHSDVDLKMGPNNTMYMFYRWYANVDNGGTEEKLRYMTTTNGVNWSAPVDMYVNDHDVRRLMSPSLVYEDGGWTMWAVDILPSPNRVVRTRSTGATPNSGWATPTNLTVTSQSGKEPWHIFVMKMGGRYFSLLNDCALDQNGMDGDLLFMQSYDGSIWETSTSPVIPRSQAGQHDKLYRATMVPGFDNGAFGFRVWYAGWVSSPTIIWNIYRTFLKPAALVAGAKQIYAPLSPTGFVNTGNIVATDLGTKVQIDLDIRFKKGVGTLALTTTYANIGVTIPPQLRVNVDVHTRHWVAWVNGTGYLVHLFVNFYSGAALIRLPTGTASWLENQALDLTATVFFDRALLP